MSEESPRWGMYKADKLVVNKFNEFPEKSKKKSFKSSIRNYASNVGEGISDFLSKVPGKTREFISKAPSRAQKLWGVVGGKHKTRKTKKSNRKTRKNRK